jgi:hypothetical protein
MELWVRVMAEGWLTNVVRVSGEEAEGDGSDNESAWRWCGWWRRRIWGGIGRGTEATVVLGTESRQGLVVSNLGAE